MQVPFPRSRGSQVVGNQVGWACLLGFFVLLWVPVVNVLWPVWRNDASLSHGPLIPVLAAGLLWQRRSELRRWDAAAPSGLVLLAFAAILHIVSVWADIEFLKPLSLGGMLGGALWFLGGRNALEAALPALGFLAFMIPWPTTLVERLSFPLQLASSTYAALFGGLLGLPIHRDGVVLAVLPDLNAKPLYTITVAQKCSGLTSLIVLLALGYLVACFTPVKPVWRVLLVAVVAPLTLLANAVRLTLILLAGAHGNPALATWVHDHEGPFLVFLCSFALLGLRYALLVWTKPRAPIRGTSDTAPLVKAAPMEGEAIVQIPAVDH